MKKLETRPWESQCRVASYGKMVRAFGDSPKWRLSRKLTIMFPCIFHIYDLHTLFAFCNLVFRIRGYSVAIKRSKLQIWWYKRLDWWVHFTLWWLQSKMPFRTGFATCRSECFIERSGLCRLSSTEALRSFQKRSHFRKLFRRRVQCPIFPVMTKIFIPST